MHTKRPIARLLFTIVSTPIITLGCLEASAQSPADAVLAKYAKPEHPGCAVGVFQDGKTLYEGAFGLANLEHGIPIDAQRTVFDAGSVSKQFTAVSILLLAQDGKLKLNDDIRKYLPEMPDYGRRITIDHLLNNTSGLRDYFTLMWMRGNSIWEYTSEQDGLDLVSSQKALDFDPGSKYAYSNTNFFLLSQIVHRVSGQTLASFAQERIFAPLGMTQTHFKDTLGLVVPHYASGYGWLKAGAFEVRSSRYMPYGDGGLHTTIPDLAKWQRNFDEPKVGGASLIQQLEENGVLKNGEKIDYARGLEVFKVGSGYHGLRTVTHSGGTWDGYRSDVMRLSDHKFSIALLCNSDYMSFVKVRNELTNLFMGDKLPAFPEAAQADPVSEPEPDPSVSLKDAAARFVGSYWNREDTVMRRIELSDGKLWYVRSPDSRTELVPIGKDQLQMRGVAAKTVVELLSSKKGPPALRVAGKTLLEKVEPFSSGALPDYAGVYASDELGGARITIAPKDGGLTLVPQLKQGDLMEPAFKDAFFVEDGEVILRFQRNRSGRIISMFMESARARNVVFKSVAKERRGTAPKP